MIFKRRAKPAQIYSKDELAELAETGKPILVDFFQFGCAPCQVMDGIVNELAAEFEDEAHVVKINVGKVPWAVQEYKIRSTPTLMVLAPPRQSGAKKGMLHQRWRASGLVKKEAITDVLVKAGAEPPLGD